MCSNVNDRFLPRTKPDGLPAAILTLEDAQDRAESGLGRLCDSKDAEFGHAEVGRSSEVHAALDAVREAIVDLWTLVRLEHEATREDGTRSRFDHSRSVLLQSNR